MREAGAHSTPSNPSETPVISTRVFGLTRSKSSVFIERNEIYETWIIRKVEGNTRRTERSWTLLGLKVNEQLNHDIYSVEGVPCSQEKMKSRYEALETGKGVLERTLANLPSGAYREIEWLIQERMRISSVAKRLRTWTLVDVGPAAPIMPRQPQPWMSWVTGKSDVLDYMVVLKAESSRDEGLTYPNRLVDPFRKNNRIGADRRRRTRSPIESIRGEERYERNDHVVDRQRGDIEISSDPTPEEAHAKIEETLAGLIAAGKKDSDS